MKFVSLHIFYYISVNNEIFEISIYVINTMQHFNRRKLHKKRNDVPLKELQIRLSRIDDHILHKIAKENKSYKKKIRKRKCLSTIRI